MKKNILLYAICSLAILLSPVLVSAQTNAVDIAKDTAKKIAEDKISSETGLDQIKDLYSGAKILDKIIEYIRGDIPSPLMGNLLNQISAEGKFKLWTIKTSNGSVPYAANSCKRAANQYMQSGLFNARIKAHFTPWVDISWSAVKSIADGGKSIGELIADNTKENVEKTIKETLFGKNKQKVENVTIPSYDSCNSVTKITWDPNNMKITAVTSGDCGCKLINVDGGKQHLGKYKVTLTAPVTVENVKIEVKNRFILWKKYNIQAQYKVGKLNVQTDADCDCNKDTPPPPPPPKKEKTWIGSIIDWLFGKKDGIDEPEDKTDIIDKTDNTDNTKDTDNIDKPDDMNHNEDKSQEDNDTTNKEDKKENNKTSDKTDSNDNTSKDSELKCGDLVSVDGRTNVPTFKFDKKSEYADVNFDCDGTCNKNQECRVLPESVRAYAESCVYCKNIEPEIIPEEEVKDEVVTTTCEMPSKQMWNNAIIPGFKYTVLNDTMARVENAGEFCGFNTLAEFKDSADRMVKFLTGVCATAYADDFVFSDIRANCSFVTYFK